MDNDPSPSGSGPGYPSGGGMPPPPPGSGGYGPGSGPPGPHGSGPAGQGPYGSNPYGGAQGAVDPLAGMPPLGSLPRRVIARIIDFLVVGIPVALVLGLTTDMYDGGFRDQSNWGQNLIYLLVYFVYEGAMLSTRGQTIGKMAMRVRVAMLNDGALPAGSPGWARAATYSLPQLVPVLGFLFWLLNVLFCTWDRPYRQCLHDKVAKTVVVSAR